MAYKNIEDAREYGRKYYLRKGRALTYKWRKENLNRHNANKMRDYIKHRDKNMKKMSLKYHCEQESISRLYGGACMSCGNTETLCFHHIDPRTKSFDVALGTTYKNKLEEAKKCWLICNSCHQKIHHQMKEI